MLLTLLLVLQAAAPEKCSLEGRVLRAGAGEPIRKVQLTLIREQNRPSNSPIAVSDDNGRFSFKDLDPGRYQLSAERNGYVRQMYGQRGQAPRAGAALVLERGQTLRDIVFRLIPAAVLAGRVVDDDGEPVTNVRVQLFRYGYFQGKRQRMPGGGASTNDLGEYRIFGLAPGRYFLNATWASMGAFGSAGVVGVTSGPEPAELTYAPTYFPGTADAAQAAPIEITPGAELRGIDLRLLKIPTVRIRGKVLNAVTGRPGRGLMVGLVARNDPYSNRSFSAVEAADGSFELRGVVPGSYELTANWSEGDHRYFAAQAIEVANSHIEGVQLVIAPGPDISGRLRIEGQADLGSAETRVSLQPAENRPMFGGGGMALVKDDGSFAFRNVSPGTYRISFYSSGSGSEDLYLQSARLGDADLLDSDLEIRAGQTLGQLELVASAKSARVEGSVSDDQGKPLSGIQVVLVPDSRRRSITRLFKMATTDQNGRFTLRGIAPGEYKVFAFEELEFGAQYDPDFLKQHEEKGKPVSLGENSRESLTLKLSPSS